MQSYVEELRACVEHGSHALLLISEDASSRRPAPDKWSPREVIGHLIDSASNNHQRFVRAQFQDDLVFPGYDQDAWVARAGFNDRIYEDLVQEWIDVRRASISLLKGLPPGSPERTGVANGLGFTTRSLAYVLPGHVEWHQRVLEDAYGLGVPLS